MKKNLDDPRAEVFPWSQATSSELGKLEAAQNGPECWFPDELSPLIDNSNLHEPSSFGLRFKGELIGWTITHLSANERITFVTAFARSIPEYPLAGLRMIQETTRAIIAAASLKPIPLSCSVVKGNKFLRFMERQVFKHIETKSTELDVISKQITSTTLKLEHK